MAAQGRGRDRAADGEEQQHRERDMQRSRARPLDDLSPSHTHTARRALMPSFSKQLGEGAREIGGEAITGACANMSVVGHGDHAGAATRSAV